MCPFSSLVTVTAPALVSICTSFQHATPSALVRSSGCTLSQIFFFCTLRTAGQRQPQSERRDHRGNALVLRIGARLRRVAEADPLAHGCASGRGQLRQSEQSEQSERSERRAEEQRASSTFSWAASEAARSMPNDFTPRMLRAFRLQSTTTRRPCAAETNELSALNPDSLLEDSRLKLLFRHIANQARADLRSKR